jgi:NADP-dependent 3-hydroxy acid dehydrogenase YdfG
MTKVILLTQAHDREGALIAAAVASSECVVYAGMPDKNGWNINKVLEMQQYAEATDLDLRPIELDLKDDASVGAAIEQIIVDHGRIDVVIHRAGGVVKGGKEQQEIADEFPEFENELQNAESIRRVVFPELCRQRSGLLVWVAGYQRVMDVIASEYAAELRSRGVETCLLFKERTGFSGPTSHESFLPPDVELAQAVAQIVRLGEGRRPRQIDVGKVMEINS